MSSLKKNIIYQSLYEVLILFLPLATAPYISRVLGAEKLGIYSFTVTIANYFALFARLGIANHGSRAIARVRGDSKQLNRIFSALLSLHVVLAMVVCAIYMAYLIWLTGEYQLLQMIQSLYLLSALLDVNWLFVGLEKFKLTVTRNMIVKITSVALIFLLVKEPDDLWIYVFIMAAGGFLGQTIIWTQVPRYVKFVRPKWDKMHVHIKPLFVLFIPVIAVSLYKYMDKIMMGWLSTKEQLGLYESTDRIATVPLSLITAFGTVMLPHMANLQGTGNQRQVSRYMNLSMQSVLWLSVALCFGLAGVGREFAPVFFGTQFAGCGELIALIAPSLPFIAFANVLRTQYLIPRHEDHIYIVSVFTGAVVNLALNGLLIPRFASVGAILGTVAAEISVCLVQAYAVRKELPIRTYVNHVWIPLLAGVSMYLIVRMVSLWQGASVVGIMAQVLVGFASYCGLTAFMYIWRKDPVVTRMLNNGVNQI